MPSFELTDPSAKYKSDDFGSTDSRKPDGMYISTAKGFILAFLAIAIAVGVGIIVYFAGTSRDLECTCTSSQFEGVVAALDGCKQLATGGNSEICSSCPKQNTSSTCQPDIGSTSPTAIVATTTSGSTTAPPVLDVRLPMTIEPLLYTVELQPHMYAPLKAEEFTFNGSVTILFHCIETTRTITLHSNKLNITGNIHVLEVNGVAELFESHEFDLDRQFLKIHTNTDLISSRNYTVDITGFVGPLVADLAGLYLSSYARGNETIFLATTLMAPTDARKTFPCFDEPSFKAEFDIILVRKEDRVSISNMPLLQTENRGDNWFADKFERTPKMSTYLLAFIICDFNYTENVTTNNIEYRAWSRPEAIDQTPYSLQVGVEILSYFENYFNITYPLPKQDMIAIPDFAAGAMENWGLITYRETAMLYEPGVSSESNKQRVAVVVSHELAHQWFGNLVTPSWWDDLWLNEGFASYVEYMGVDIVHPDWKMFEQFVIWDLQDVFNFDGLISSHPVYVPVAHPDEINEIFDRISYAKGASIIRMMRFFLGDSTFQRGLTRYLRELAYGAAFHDDLWYALGNQSMAEGKGIDVKTIMDTWTLQMNYPVVMMTHNNEGRITLTQSRYLQDPNAPDPGKFVSPFGYKWDIPFTYTTSMEQHFNVTSDDVIMMRKQTQEQVIESDKIPAPSGDAWLLGNPMQYGYYRVNYDTRNWNALIEQLKRDHTVIHTINRAQIINDAWNLAKSGDIDMNIALRTTEYLDKEREYIPWRAVSSELGFVRSMLEKHPLYGSFEKFMQNKTRSVFAEITMNNTGASHLEAYMRGRISYLACSYGIQDCIDQSKQQFSDWMANPSVNPIDPDLKSVVYCTAIQYGGITEWEFALAQYKMSNLATEKSLLQSALSCTRETWILSRYLHMSIDPTEIRRQDAVSVIVTISRNVIGRQLAWSFLVSNWDYLLNEFGGSFAKFQGLIQAITRKFSIEHELYQCRNTKWRNIGADRVDRLVAHGGGLYKFPRLIGAITHKFLTKYQLQQLKTFIDSKEDLGSGQRAFEQALEKTQSNIQWMESNVPVIEGWLKSQGY